MSQSQFHKPMRLSNFICFYPYSTLVERGSGPSGKPCQQGTVKPGYHGPKGTYNSVRIKQVFSERGFAVHCTLKSDLLRIDARYYTNCHYGLPLFGQSHRNYPAMNKCSERSCFSYFTKSLWWEGRHNISTVN